MYGAMLARCSLVYFKLYVKNGYMRCGYFVVLFILWSHVYKIILWQLHVNVLPKLCCCEHIYTIDEIVDSFLTTLHFKLYFK